jgi:MinD superfamily P-loop ATPase
MKQLVILSGKGGTGKTTAAAALADLASRDLRLVLADTDVDAANLELLLGPVDLEENQPFAGRQVPIIDAGICSRCGVCADVCRFGAILERDTTYYVDRLACEGCAACFYQCPEGAIEMNVNVAGRWFRSHTRLGPLFHAHLFAGQENSGRLVTLVKQQAQEQARAMGADLLLVDGPPGVGCPVIAACGGADLALLVAEPTVSGEHGLERALATTSHFGVPPLVMINKADLNPDRRDQIERFCTRREIPLVGQIPYDTVVTRALTQGQPVTQFTQGPVRSALVQAWREIARHLEL